ncbi:IS3 family transposase, partial [Escherichia coli]|uniref:IS3 family transposase n=1 Tax=Escherichia coli TaxID=562 RepID=UPI002B224194
LKDAVTEYIEYYNSRRISLKLKGLTPKSWTVKHEAYRSDSDIQLESDLLISG